MIPAQNMPKGALNNGMILVDKLTLATLAHAWTMHWLIFGDRRNRNHFFFFFCFQFKLDAKCCVESISCSLALKTAGRGSGRLASVNCSLGSLALVDELVAVE